MKKIIYISLITILLPAFAWAVLEIDKPESPVETLSNIGEISDKSAILSGTAPLPLGTATSAKAYFRLATVSPPPVFCKQVYGSNMIFTREKKFGPSSGLKQFSITAGGLRPNTKYYFCAIVSTKDKIYYGDVEGPFTTLPLGCGSSTECSVVSVEALPAIFIAKDSAYLKGNFQTTEPVSLWFEYGKNKSGENLTSAKKTSAEDASPSAGAMTAGTIAVTLENLETDTRYFFQLVAKNKTADELVRSQILEFKTLAEDVVIDLGGEVCQTDTDCAAPATCQNEVCVGPTGPVDDVPTCDVDCSGPGNQAYLDAIVRSREGVEHVLYRQIRNKDVFLQRHGLAAGDDKNAFALNLAHSLALVFGYADESRREVRVKYPDMAAYVLREFNQKLFVDEYFRERFLGTRVPSFELKRLRSYEYYFRKR